MRDEYAPWKDSGEVKGTAGVHVTILGHQEISKGNKGILEQHKGTKGQRDNGSDEVRESAFALISPAIIYPLCLLCSFVALSLCVFSDLVAVQNSDAANSWNDVEGKKTIGYTGAVISGRNPLLRSIALGLPLCFLWLFAVCVANCSTHRESKSSCVPLTAEACLSDQHESDCCPVTATPVSALTDRRLSSPQMRATQQVVAALPTLAIDFVVSCRAQISIPNTGTGPPTERFCALRI